MLRAKGWFWVATRPNQCASFQLAGGTRETGVAGSWWASVPAARRPQDAGFTERLQTLWDPLYGDRRQEIVLIGTGLDEATLRAGFDRALLDDAELDDPETWSNLEDPFPWPEVARSA